MKQTKGITLVALVVTVIVLMILAGITVTLVLGQNGIMGKAKQASEQTRQSTAEEDLKMMLTEYYTDKETGDTETLKDYLDKQVTADKIDSEQANGSNYDVTLEGYIFTVDSNTLDIISSSKNIVPQVSNIKIVANSDGTGDNLGENSTTSGTTLYITFTATMSDGSDVTVSPSIPYAVTKNATYNFTITGKVDGKELTKTISVTVNQYKPIILAKVGDFVNYSAGTWTQADITSLGTLYSGANLSTDSGAYEFGGFKVGDSRDNSITPFDNYTNKYTSGWRVLDLNTDGSIKDIVHAGTSEGFYFYDNSSQAITTLTSTRKWDMYVNTTYATSAYCMTYNEVYSITGSMASTTNDLRTTGSWYCLAGNPPATNNLWAVMNNGGLDGAYIRCLGVRPVVSLKSGIQITGGSGTSADPYQMK